MSRIPKGAMFGIAVSGVVLALLAFSLLLMNGGGQSTQAQGGTGADPNIIGIDVKIDDDGDTTPDNTQSTLGVINSCVEVAADETFSVDVFLDDIPTGQDFSTQDYFLSFDPTKLTAVSQDHSPSLILLGLDPQSNLFNASPAPSATAFHSAVLDTYIPAADAAEQPGDLGVLGRYTLQATGTGLTMLNLSDNTIILGNSTGIDWFATDIDQVWDDNYTPPYGLVAIAPATCGALVDLEKVSFAPGNFDLDDNGSYETAYTPGLDIPVSSNIWFEVDEVIQNNGPALGLQALVTVTCTPPESLAGGSAGGQCSYHVEDAVSPLVSVPTVTVDGTPLDCDPGSPPAGVTCTGVCTAGACPVSTIIEVEWPHVLDVEKQTVDLTDEGTPVPLPTEEWDVHCYEPSTHVWHFTNDIESADMGVIDTDDTNNHLDFDLSLDCIAESDFSITNPAVDAPTTAGQGGTFDVVVSADVNNNGPYGPATADATFDLTLGGTATCSKIPVGSQTVTGITLGNGGSSSRDATWQVTCTTTGTATFDGDISVALAAGQPHIADSTGANDSDSASDSTDITASADARIIDWVFPDDMAPPAAVGAAETGDQCENAVDDDGDTVVNDGCPDIAGNQLLVDPGVAEDLDTTETLDNNPANTTYTDTSIDVDVDVDVTVTSGTCTATPDPLSISTQLLLDGTDNVLLETWSANLTSGDSCSIDFAKTVTITTGGVGEFYGTDNSLTISADLVADTDGDTVPDNYAGIVDNCPDDSNPDQSDVDGDGIGDVCDADNDNDGICDPGKSAAYCTGSDNCPLISNPGQEDEDADTIGDVCELDVDCSGGQTDISDAWMIGQYILGRANFSLACPPPAGTINGPRASAYVAYPAGGTITDVVMVLQCVLGEVNNLVCPVAPSR